MQNLKNQRILMRLVIVVIILVSHQFFAKAQTTAKPSAAATAKPATAAPVVSKGAQAHIETFFKKYKTSSDSAIDYIFGTNKLFSRNASQINALKMRMDSLQFTLGKYTGKELISQKSASPSLVVYSYLAKHENQPIRFTFIFYKAQNDWVLYRFNFDDSMDQELFEAVKINNKH